METSILHVNNSSFTGPLIIGTFEKRVHIYDKKERTKRNEHVGMQKGGNFTIVFNILLIDCQQVCTQERWWG